uniref:CTTNBP2 N-terminal-like protein n=1 Tax=Podarcis muralis TaxID=64176 RepID=A0A670I726_PODMU
GGRGGTKCPMNLEKLSKPELLTLFSILEGELEARDLVIEALKAQRRDAFIEERYGKFNISDPLMALQRDFEALKEENHGDKQPVCANPLSILKVVMKHCKNMQEKMLSQLAAAESRHRKLEFEKSQVKKFEREQKKLSSQLEEEHAHHKQLSSMLVLECKKAAAKAAEEGQKLGELSGKLEKERSKVSQLEEELAAKKKRGLQMEAQVEKQLSEFDIEREQLRAKLNREENRTKALKEEVEQLKQTLKELEASCKAENPPPSVSKVSIATVTEDPCRSVACQTESPLKESQGSTIKLARALSPVTATAPQSYAKANGHCEADAQASVEPAQPSMENLEKNKPAGSTPEGPTENSSSPVRTESLSPSIPPLPSSGISFPSYQSSYQVGINQRFHAARHKFQSQADQDHPSSGLQSPPSRDLSPTLVDNSAAKQLARNTVTQVLSRFTSQQGPIKPVSPNSSPFGTDYRTLASAMTERGNPPPIPPKKPGLAPSPASHTPPTKTSSQAPSLGSPADLASSCSINAVVANGKEIEILLPANKSVSCFPAMNQVSPCSCCVRSTLAPVAEL